MASDDLLRNVRAKMQRPLTKKDRNGNPYTRPATIVTAIEAALQLERSHLVQAARVSSRQTPDFIPLECLVYLIRDAWRRRDDSTVSALLLPFLARCEAILKVKVRDDDIPNAPEVRESILSDLSLLFVQDGSGDNPDELDFFECRFNLAFKAFRTDFLLKEWRRANVMSSLPAEDEHDASAPSSDEDVFARVAEAFRCAPTQQDNLRLEALVEAINDLPPDQRDVVILCHVLGYKEEAEDPDEETAATRCGVTGRTIRNRLTRAAATLSRFKEEK